MILVIHEVARYYILYYIYILSVVESQQKWSSYEVNSRILDNNYLRWYLFYLNKRTKDSTARTLPQEVSINSIDLAILFSYRNFSVNAVSYTDLWPSHQIRATYRQMHFWRCIFSLSKTNSYFSIPISTYLLFSHDNYKY